MDEVLRQLAAMRAEFKGELGEVKAGLAAVDGKFDANSSSLQQINSWREGVDAQVVDLTASLDAIRKQVDRVVVGVGLSALGTPPGAAALPVPLAPHNARAASQEQGSGQTGHGEELLTGGETVEHSLVSLSTPVTGSDGENSPEAEEFVDALADTHEAEFMAISKQAFNGSENGHSMKLMGQIQGHDVLILVDSGSTNNFISTSLAAQLQGVQKLSKPVKVKVAGGGMLQGDLEVPGCEWTCQGNVFATSFKALPLHCYDVILGMQWLEQFGLMQTHWAQKWFQFEWNGKQCRLQGLQPNTKQCDVISPEELKSMYQQDSIYYMVQLYFTVDKDTQKTVPHIVSMVLNSFEDVFAEPTGLPPHRRADHTIPLMPGASPVNLRPYRYSPMQKNEIEKQIRELIAQGVIQPSASPFASPVLLVGKKDLTWRLCVDYRHLNALTIKNKYPLPVIDELLDELAGAQWFTSLDLRAGYHQIRMAEGEEYKTAFQTHHGHFEYKVLQKVGKVAYKLDLPSTSRIHNVIHVSQLKKALGKNVVVQDQLPAVEAQDPYPDMVLGERWRKQEGVARSQVLIRWQGLPDAMATWEDKEDLRLRFPEHPAWGQAGSQDGGNVMDLNSDVASTSTGKQKRRLRRAGRKPARVSGPEWTL
ncbi:hypothetical protein QYE76_071575 [Lolium multiflorum]|uniref:Chromo domain-containing protein n=1 Tax=Lolium multiflorum TaxID=4521 RepID=A0AAD8SK21_LOLMU|nr:hypothetical protein QYE76_071575 [Lolium multiflorum]